MNPKQLFQRNKDLRDKLSAVAHSDWFSEALVYAFSEFSQTAKNSDMLSGARAFQEVLLSLADEEPVLPERIKSGLKHDFDEEKKPETTEPKP